MKEAWSKKLIVVVVVSLVGFVLLMAGCVPLGQRSARTSQFRNTPAEDAQAYCESKIQKPSNTGLRRGVGMAGLGSTGMLAGLTVVNPVLGIVGGLVGIATSAKTVNDANVDENWYYQELSRCMQQEMSSGKYASRY